MISILLTFGILVVEARAGEIPDVVIQYANAFAQSQPIKGTPADQALYEEYARYFFQGYTHPSGGAYTDSALIQDAYMRGQVYWRDHPAERAAIFSGYGYVPVEREGVWSRGFEKSDFEPSGADGDKWWITTFGGRPWSEVGLDRGMENGRARIRIVGYLSPKGHYGHLGAYEHEVLVTSGVPVFFSNH
jgi:hypothetical protein